MQTFLPYESFTRSARVLDQQRLGKQRVECLQVLNVFAGVREGWGNHPITRMWTGYELALVRYGLTVCQVWRRERGFNDTCYGKIRRLFPSATLDDIRDAEPPPWLGDPAFHRSHQSNLVRKRPDIYGPIFPGVPDDLPYIWPV